MIPAKREGYPHAMEHDSNQYELDSFIASSEEDGDPYYRPYRGEDFSDE